MPTSPESPAGSPGGRAPTVAAASPTAPSLDAAPDLLVGLLAQLRAVTTRSVRRMRAAGARPEQMLVRVKACVREALAAEGWHDVEAVQVITAHVVSWSIAAYYDP